MVSCDVQIIVSIVLGDGCGIRAQALENATIGVRAAKDY